MTRCKRLRKLRLAFGWRLGRLQLRVELLLTAPAPERDLAISYVAIEGLNAWRLFSRSIKVLLPVLRSKRRHRKEKADRRRSKGALHERCGWVGGAMLSAVCQAKQRRSLGPAR